MNKAKTPRSLRSNAAMNSVSDKSEIHAGKVTAVAGLMAVATFSGAEAQQSNLPPVTVDAPVNRPRPQCPAARRSPGAADPGCAGAVSERRHAEPGPQSLCGCGRALQGRPRA